MRLPVVVENFVQVFAGNIELVGEIVIAGGEHDLARTVIVDGVVPVGCSDTKVTVLARDGLYPFVLAHVQLKVLGDSAVIFQRFKPGGFRQGGGEWNVPDLEQLRRGEEHHVVRVVIDGIDEASLIDDEGLKASLVGLDGAGHAGGASAHDQDVAQESGRDCD